MMAIFNIETDKHECPDCDCVLISFDGERQICPSCGAREIDYLRMKVKNGIKREKHWQRVAGRMASIANNFYQRLDYRNLPDNDKSMIQDWFEEVVPYVSFDENPSDQDLVRE